MKFALVLKKVMTLLCCHALVWAPSVFAQDEFDPNDQFAEQRKACLKTPGKQWDEALQQCLQTPESVEQKADFQNCQALPTPQERKKCHADLANKELAEEGVDLNPKEHEDDDFAKYGVMAMSVYNLWLAYATKDFTGGSCYGKKLLMFASLANLGGEVALYFMLKEKSEAIKKDFEKENAEQDSYDLQRKAFQNLKKQHEAIGKNAGKKAQVYTIVGGLYALTAGVTAIEWAIKYPTHGDPCLASAPAAYNSLPESNIFLKNDLELAARLNHYANKEQLQANLKSARNDLEGFMLLEESRSLAKISPAADYYEQMLTYFPPQDSQNKRAPLAELLLQGLAIADKYSPQLHPLPSAHAKQEIKVMGIAVAIGAPILIAQLAPVAYFNKYTRNSLGIIVLSGIASTLTFKLANAAKAQEKRSGSQADEIQKVIDKFMNSASGFCHKRDDRSVPRCYCTLADGNRNPTKVNSETCIAYFQSLEAKEGLAATNYNEASKPAIKGCLKQNDDFDEFCKCKLSDTCKKVPVIQTTANFGSASALSNVLADGGKLVSGKFSNGELSAGSIGNNAKRAAKATEKVLKSLSNKRQKEGLGGIPLGGSAFNKNLIARTMPKQNVLDKFAASNNPFNLKGVPPKLQQALKQAKAIAKVEDATILPSSSAAPLLNKNKSSDDELGFNFGGNANDSSNGTVQSFDSSVGEEQMIGDNDIVKKSDISIWKILHSRYNTTGYKRLFEEEADKPEVTN